MTVLKNDFLKMLSAYQGILHKVNLIYFRYADERKDNFQEIVYQMWKTYPALRSKSNIASWIYAISINTSISRIRKDARIEYKENIKDTFCSEEFEERLDTDEDFKLLLQAIYNLNDIDKSIMLLYLEEKSYEEIAEIIGITKTNVGTRINRAKDILKQNLIKMGYEKG